MEISSEVYEELNLCSTSQDSKYMVTNFQYKNPDKNKKTADYINIQIGHYLSTNLELVGHQIWRGSLLLSDFLVNNRNDYEVIGHNVLELGSGCGLTTIVAAINHRQVICSDVDSILNLIKDNLNRNRDLIERVKVLEIDFLKSLSDHVIEVINKIDTIIAADIIYDNQITEGLINNILKPIFSRKSNIKFYLALEKRYVFSIDDCDTVAPCYEHFRQMIIDIDQITIRTIPIEEITQFFHYKRVPELILLEIKLTK